MAGKIVTIKEPVQIDKLLAGLSDDLKAKGLVVAVRAAGKVVAQSYKNRLPVDTGNLKRSVAVKTIKRDRSAVAIVGARRGIRDGATPADRKGNHAHLVEEGWTIKTRSGGTPLTGKSKVEGGRYLQTAVDTTQVQQTAAMVKALTQFIAKHNA